MVVAIVAAVIALGGATIAGLTYRRTARTAVAVEITQMASRAPITILHEEWNQLKTAGVTLNNANPLYLENWYFAIWGYNSGFHAPSGSAPWGLASLAGRRMNVPEAPSPRK